MDCKTRNVRTCSSSLFITIFYASVVQWTLWPIWIAINKPCSNRLKKMVIGSCSVMVLCTIMLKFIVDLPFFLSFFKEYRDRLPGISISVCVFGHNSGNTILQSLINCQGFVFLFLCWLLILANPLYQLFI